MTETFDGTINSMDTKVGNKGGKPWKIFELGVSGATFSTFSELLVKDLNIGEEVRIEYVIKKKGMYENYEIQTIRRKEEVVKMREKLGQENTFIIGGVKYKAIFVKVD